GVARQGLLPVRVGADQSRIMRERRQRRGGRIGAAVHLAPVVIDGLDQLPGFIGGHRTGQQPGEEDGTGRADGHGNLRLPRKGAGCNCDPQMARWFPLGGRSRASEEQVTRGPLTLASGGKWGFVQRLLKTFWRLTVLSRQLPAKGS